MKKLLLLLLVGCTPAKFPQQSFVRLKTTKEVGIVVEEKDCIRPTYLIRFGSKKTQNYLEFELEKLPEAVDY